MVTEPKINTRSSSVNGTDDREAHSLCWYAVRTQINCERKVEKEFQNIAEETYLPVQEEIHNWSDRKKKIRRIVIPTILFVKMYRDEVKKVHRTRYFYGFLGYDRHNSQPASIPEKDIATLQYMLGQSTSPVTIEPMPIILGDKVQVNRGCLKGLVGHVLAHSEGEAYIFIKIDILGCAKVSISLSDVAKIQ
jgi:transcription antitermination factor NusG